MNAVEIAEAVTALAERPFDASEFPFAFLEAFGNKEATIKRLRAGATNKSDMGGVLQTNNIHIAVCPVGDTSKKLAELRDSPATTKARAKFILATDGAFLEAEDINTGETVACSYLDFPNHFGFFLALAGITTVQQIRESSFDIRATGRLNKLYIELLKDNPEWGMSDRRHEMNHFMARLIFCFFAEDTGIFQGESLFTGTVERMSAKDSENTHEVIGRIFQAMNTRTADREAAQLPLWIKDFPYVNGGLFSGSTESPRFSRIARSYLLHIGSLDWKQINPDIFGSMIQAVADDEERGALGMHYTSVPNILKVLNPLFLDDLREKLEEAGDNPRSLLNLRKRMSRIRILDPACGSGNFLVIAYREMRAIEAEINKRRGEEANKPSEIRLTNFRGIELRDFPAEIARLALIIAEYQCDVRYRGERLALAEFLPLDGENWITCGNALRLDWLSICPPTGTGVRLHDDDLFNTPLDQAEIDFENEGGETYICGNPPYYGSRKQTKHQKEDLAILCGKRIAKWKSLDYVAGWFLKARVYIKKQPATFAFVCTSSNCEGLQVPVLWKDILKDDVYISFAYRPFKWANLAANNAGVTVNIVGVSNIASGTCKKIFEADQARIVSNISPYLLATPNIFVDTSPQPRSRLSPMITGSMPRDGGNLILSFDESIDLTRAHPEATEFIRPYVGTNELVKGTQRSCLWIDDEKLSAATRIPYIASRLDNVRMMRAESTLKSTQEFASKPHRFVYLAGESRSWTIGVGGVSSESREYLPVDLFERRTVLSNLAYALYDAPVLNIALIASRMHLVWIATVCGKLETRLRYSNTLGWNTFPVPTLTEKNMTDLTYCAEDILLTREAHFPATIADLYDPDNMPLDLRNAHKRNDEVVERIYIGRRFKNDTERLEKLFELYTKMISVPTSANKRKTSNNQ